MSAAPQSVRDLVDTYNLVANGWPVARAREEVARRHRVAELRELVLRVKHRCLIGRRS